MKRAIIPLFAVALMLSPVIACAKSYGARHDAVQKYFISDAEPRVKDALWTQATIFKIGVFDDGTSRNGFAQYACQILYDHGFKGEGVLVKIIDIVKLVRKGQWVTLGEAQCD